MDLRNQLHQRDPIQLEASEDRDLQTRPLRHRRSIECGEPRVARLSGAKYDLGLSQGGQTAGSRDSCRR